MYMFLIELLFVNCMNEIPIAPSYREKNNVKFFIKTTFKISVNMSVTTISAESLTDYAK